MAEPKPLASLTSGLLARKGAAQPAMRRPMLGFGAVAAAPVQDDLGWNDMGFDMEPVADATTHHPSPPIGLTPLAVTAPVDAPEPPVVSERRHLARRIAQTQAKSTAPKAARTPSRKAAFTLRIDADRHLRLRLATAVTGRSAQQIVTQALDEFLNTLPDIDRLTQQLPPRNGGR